MVNWSQYAEPYRDYKTKNGVAHGTAAVGVTPNAGKATLAMGLPSLFMTLSSKMGSWLEDDSSGAEVSERGKEIQGDIDKVFEDLKGKGLECASISDVELQIQMLNGEKNKLSTQTVPSLENNIAGNQETVTNLTAVQGGLAATIKSLKAEKNNPEVTVERLAAIDAQIGDAEYEYTENEKKIEQLNAQIESDNKSLAESNARIEKIDADISVLDDALIDLKELERQLKKADGRDAIENLTNEDTADISDILKQIKSAQANGDSAKVGKLQEKLEKAIEKYYENHEVGDNKTFDKLPQAQAYLKKQGLN